MCTSFTHESGSISDESMGGSNCTVEIETKLSQFGNFIEKVVKIKRFEAPGFAVFYHSDSSAGVNDKDRCYIFRHTSMIYFFTKSSEYGLKRIGFGCVGYATFFCLVVQK